MTKGLQRSISRGHPQARDVIKETLIAKDVAITIDGATGVGFGSVAIGDFPEGNILFLGATSYMSISGPTSANLVDTWSGDFGVGTTPADDGTITAGDIDLIGSTPLGPAVAEVSPRTRGISVAGDTGEIHDNTDGSLEINLNVLVDDADIDADGIVCTATGELHIAYMMLGDD
ncbi:hypothetical protein KAR91_64135 [Candidatus Pacearchaeota archaeon]|nr:hypothetical protein [Candidatus Pacearchaeota archaeon]